MCVRHSVRCCFVRSRLALTQSAPDFHLTAATVSLRDEQLRPTHICRGITGPLHRSCARIFQKGGCLALQSDPDQDQTQTPASYPDLTPRPRCPSCGVRQTPQMHPRPHHQHSHFELSTINHEYTGSQRPVRIYIPFHSGEHTFA